MRTRLFTLALLGGMTLLAGAGSSEAAPALRPVAQALPLSVAGPEAIVETVQYRGEDFRRREEFRRHEEFRRREARRRRAFWRRRHGY